MDWLIYLLFHDAVLLAGFTLFALLGVSFLFAAFYRRPEPSNALVQMKYEDLPLRLDFHRERIAQLESIGFKPAGGFTLANILNLHVLASADHRTIGVVLSGSFPTGEVKELRLSSLTLSGRLLTTVNHYAVPDITGLQTYQISVSDSALDMMSLHDTWISRDGSGVHQFHSSFLMNELQQLARTRESVLIQHGYARYLPPDNRFYIMSVSGVLVTWLKSSLMLIAILARMFLPYGDKIPIRY